MKHTIQKLALMAVALAAAAGCNDQGSGDDGNSTPPPGGAFNSPEGIAVAGDYLLVANTALRMENAVARWDKGFVTVIHRVSRAVLHTIPTTAPNTQGVYVRGDTAYVVNSGETSYTVGMVTPATGGSVDILDLSAGPPTRVARSIPLPLGSGDPRIGSFGDLLPDPQGKVAYLGSGTRGDLFKVDLVAGKVLRGADNPIALFPTKDGHNGLTLLRPWGQDGLAVINLNSEELCLSKDWAGDLASRTCHAVKVQKNQLSGPVDLAWAPDGTALLLTTLANALYRVDVKASPFKLAGRCTPTGLSPNRVLLHGDQGYIINSLSANLQRVDPVTCASKNPFVVFPTGSNPYDMVITSEKEGDLAWVTLFKHHGVALVDLKSGKVIGRVKIPGALDAGSLDAALADAGAPDQAPSDGAPAGDARPPDSSAPIIAAATVEKVSYGAGAGHGQASMPGVIQGGPQGGGSGGGSTDVLSLGEGGEIVLSFGSYDIVDGPGPDLIVFENPMLTAPYQPFAEPGIVGLAAKGMTAADFTDFPCDLNVTQGDAQKKTWPYPGCAGVKPAEANVKTNGIPPQDPARAGGDAFDLSTLKVKQARYLRIKDAGVSKMGTTSRGFDLDAVVLINYKKVR